MVASDKRKRLMSTGGLGRAPTRVMRRGVGFLDDSLVRLLCRPNADSGW